MRKEMTESLPVVEILPIQLKRYPQQFAYPAHTFMAPITWQGRAVGQISYSSNPLNDSLYIYRLVIKPECQRQHLALATLQRLYKEHLLPIRPIGNPHPFWQSARRMLGKNGVSIGAELSIDKLEDEARRWQHLAEAFDENVRNTERKSPSQSSDGQ